MNKMFKTFIICLGAILLMTGVFAVHDANAQGWITNQARLEEANRSIKKTNKAYLRQRKENRKLQEANQKHESSFRSWRIRQKRRDQEHQREVDNLQKEIEQQRRINDYIRSHQRPITVFGRMK